MEGLHETRGVKHDGPVWQADVLLYHGAQVVTGDVGLAWGARIQGGGVGEQGYRVVVWGNMDTWIQGGDAVYLVIFK